MPPRQASPQQPPPPRPVQSTFMQLWAKGAGREVRHSCQQQPPCLDSPLPSSQQGLQREQPARVVRARRLKKQLLCPKGVWG